MVQLSGLALVFGGLLVQASNSAVVASCAEDAYALTDLAQVRGRNAWAARCTPHAPDPFLYPEGSFVSYLDVGAPDDAEAPCIAVKAEAVLCTGEGLLPGQPVLTDLGWLAVEELEARGAIQLAAWNSTAPMGSRPPMVALTGVRRRPYRGPVVSIETAEGGLVEVSAGQALLRINSTLVRADELMAGDVLMTPEGRHHVERVVQTHRRTSVYQLHVGRRDFDHNNVGVGGVYVATTLLVQDGLAEQDGR